MTIKTNTPVAAATGVFSAAFLLISAKDTITDSRSLLSTCRDVPQPDFCCCRTLMARAVCDWVDSARIEFAGAADRREW